MSTIKKQNKKAEVFAIHYKGLPCSYKIGDGLYTATKKSVFRQRGHAATALSHFSDDIAKDCEIVRYVPENPALEKALRDIIAADVEHYGRASAGILKSIAERALGEK